MYDELRRIADSLLARESPGQTLQPTALVNEAYLKLVGPGDAAWQSRAHFFWAAARAMRQVLIDRARRVRSRGGKPGALSESAVPTLGDRTEPSLAAEQMLAMDESLQSLRARDERQHDVVMLRFFAGLTVEQTAELLNLSPATIKNEWSYARAWLLRDIARRAGGITH